MPTAPAKPATATPRNAPGTVSKTAGPADSDIMLIDDFLGSAPTDSSPSTPPSAGKK
jgi:hypothetical protein